MSPRATLQGLSGNKERDIRKVVVEYLRWQGWVVLYHLQGLGCRPGMPDLQALKAGQCVFVELKTATGKQSEAQQRFQAEVEAAGFEYILCRGIEDLDRRGI